MAKLIFKQLEEAALVIKNSLNSPLFVAEEARRLEENRFAALMEIVDYVREANFLSHASGKEKLQYFFKSHYNYKQTAAHFNCPLNCIESAISYAGKRLEKRIGRDTIRLIVQAQTQEALNAALLQFHVGINHGNAQSLFVGDLSQWLPKPANKGFRQLNEFRMEMSLLHMFSVQFLQVFLGSVDHNRLSHLLYILQSTDNTHVMERQILYRMLQGEYPNFDEAWKAWTSLQEENLFVSPDEPSPVQL